MKLLEHWLQDRWQAGQAPTTPLHDPTTGAPIACASTRGLDLAAALDHARTVGGPTLRAMTFAERGQVIARLGEALHESRDELIELARVSAGNTRGDAKFDIDGAAGTLAFYAGLGARLGDRTFLLDGEPVRLGRNPRLVGQHVLVPRVGVAIHLNAFNFPAWGLCEKAAVALLAGVPVLAKPATATAWVALRIVEIWVGRGLLPPGVLALLAGPTGDLLDHVEAQDCISFTGSGVTARRIRSHRRVLAEAVPVQVEADSLNAAVLGPDVVAGSDTFDLFVTDVVRDLVQKAGQKCTAIRRVVVPRSLLAAVEAALVARLEQQIVGDPAEASTTIGPLATAEQKHAVDEALGLLALAAQPVWGEGVAVPVEGYFVAPRLFRAEGGVDAAFVHDDEVFGPVATLLPCSGRAAEVVAIVARGGGGLVASVYSDDRDWAAQVLLGLAPWHGRVVWGNARTADGGIGPGTVLPGLVHGGPGKAGGGEELGGERGLRFYQQRTALQGDAGLLRQMLETPAGGPEAGTARDDRLAPGVA